MTATKQQTEQSSRKPVLELKEFSIQDPHSQRIYAITRDAVERLNIYVEDFFQTRQIINEQIEALSNSEDRDRLLQQTENLKEVSQRIDEVRKDMENMAREMSALISFKEVGNKNSVDHT